MARFCKSTSVLLWLAFCLQNGVAPASWWLAETWLSLPPCQCCPFFVTVIPHSLTTRLAIGAALVFSLSLFEHMRRWWRWRSVKAAPVAELQSPLPQSRNMEDTKPTFQSRQLWRYSQPNNINGCKPKGMLISFSPSCESIRCLAAMP